MREHSSGLSSPGTPRVRKSAATSKERDRRALATIRDDHPDDKDPTTPRVFADIPCSSRGKLQQLLQVPRRDLPVEAVGRRGMSRTIHPSGPSSGPPRRSVEASHTVTCTSVPSGPSSGPPRRSTAAVPSHSPTAPPSGPSSGPPRRSAFACALSATSAALQVPRRDLPVEAGTRHGAIKAPASFRSLVGTSP